MRQFFVSLSSVGIYYDHPKGPLWIPTCSTTQDILEEKYNTQCRKITGTGKRKIVFLSNGGLRFFVVSDDDVDTSTSLKDLLYLFNDLLLMRIRIPKQLYNRSINHNETQQLLQPIVKTLNHLHSNYQSILVQSIEHVELNDYNREQLINGMEKATKNFPTLAYASLFVGTKCAAQYCKIKTWKPSKRDILCLICIAQSIINEEKDKKIISRMEKLYLRKNPNQLMRCAVFFQHYVENNITFILISNDVDAKKQDFIQASNHLNDELKSFFSFLQIKSEEAHFTMLHFLHYCPGLIHFIFIDRMKERVIAPRIVSLNPTSSFSEQSSTNMDISMEFIKEHVWKMCNICKEYQELGYTEIGICSNQVQYWFKEWFEDEQGNEITNAWKLAKRHYELYTMYLPFVSTQAISKYNKVLVSLLLDK